MVLKLAKLLSRFHVTRYLIGNYNGTEYEYESYLGFYLNSSPCSVGGLNTGVWNRGFKLSLELPFYSKTWSVWR